jgi:hypothetical protein
MYSPIHAGLMEGSARPDYKACVAISTKSSLSEMIPPGALVMLTPVIVGALFGTQVRGLGVSPHHCLAAGTKYAATFMSPCLSVQVVTRGCCSSSVMHDWCTGMLASAHDIPVLVACD